MIKLFGINFLDLIITSKKIIVLIKTDLLQTFKKIKILKEILRFLFYFINKARKVIKI